MSTRQFFMALIAAALLVASSIGVNAWRTNAQDSDTSGNSSAPVCTQQYYGQTRVIPCPDSGTGNTNGGYIYGEDGNYGEWSEHMQGIHNGTDNSWGGWHSGEMGATGEMNHGWRSGMMNGH